MPSRTANPGPLPDPAPDWTLIHFDVRCPRCGEGLHGQDNPQCAACGLEFRWSDAAPAEQLTCPTCDYHVYGLTEPRCPECGGEFDWNEALQRHRTKSKPWFEYRWFDKPIGSFVTTGWRSLRPSRFWRQMNLHDPPRRGALHGLVLLVILACCLGVVVGSGLITYIGMLGINQPPIAGRFGGVRTQPSLLMVFQRFALSPASLESVIDLALMLALWSYCGRLAMSVFQQSLARARVRNAQLTRVWAYTWTSPMLVALAATYLVEVVETIRWQSFRHSAPEWGALVGIVLVTWSASRAYRHYLRIPHALAVALSVQAMAILGGTAALFVVRPPLVRRIVWILGI